MSKLMDASTASPQVQAVCVTVDFIQFVFD